MCYIYYIPPLWVYAQMVIDATHRELPVVKMGGVSSPDEFTLGNEITLVFGDFCL